ncbi:hypothetical protein BKA64DRAFT_681994 [Cadophora sp. MPI-SDFR-AT-0126]|nr:hypothetical protein BKA64DRAFT_681994 [Leotiomycetes sp. MPI-SDFR-AT-0126]
MEMTNLNEAETLLEPHSSTNHLISIFHACKGLFSIPYPFSLAPTMTPKPTTSKSPIELLPLETQQAILSSLTSIASLKQCALACPTLYTAYKIAEKVIIAQVLYNQIGIGVLPEAVLAFSSASLKLSDLESFSEANFRKRRPPPEVYTFSDALNMSEMHTRIDFLTKAFVRKALKASPYASLDESASPAEIDRIERTFYRFEIYRHIFGRFQQNREWRVQAQQNMFFKYFSPWENEQLACVHEFLAQIVIPVFNEIAAHDVFWGSTNIEPAADASSQYIQAILSRGLAHIHSIATADSYSSRRAAMYKLYPPYSDNFFHQGRNNGHTARAIIASINDSLIQCFFKDSDDGPEDAWRWAHSKLQSNLPSLMVMTNSFRDYTTARTWGYVMWDRLRLDEWGVFGKDWRQTLKFASYQELESKRQKEEEIRWEVEASWKRREELHLAGGFGWWEETDEGRVEWARGRPSPWDDVTKRRECELCIGDVRCAPHRLVLRIKDRC